MRYPGGESMDVNTLLSALLTQIQERKEYGVTENNSAKTASNNGVNFADCLNASGSSGGSSVGTLDSIFEEAAQTYQVDVNLLRAIGMAESGFHADATSHAGAQGIMQLMPGTAEYLGVEDAYDAKQNIFGGAKYISQLLKQYNGDTSLALAAYNAGSGNVRKYGGIPPFEETQNYVKKVLDYYKNGVTIPADRNVVSIAGNAESNNILAASLGVSGDAAGNGAANVSDKIVAIWNTNNLGAKATGTISTEDNEALLSKLQELLLALNEEKTEFSYEDYGRFLKVYLDRISLSTFQNAVNGKNSGVPEELQEAMEDFQAEMNGEENSSSNDNLDMMYSYQSLNYNPTVLKLLNTKDTGEI